MLNSIKKNVDMHMNNKFDPGSQRHLLAKFEQ